MVESALDIGRHRDFTYDGRSLTPVIRNTSEPRPEGAGAETTSLPEPNERGVVRIPKDNGPRRLTVVGTPDQFPAQTDLPK